MAWVELNLLQNPVLIQRQLIMLDAQEEATEASESLAGQDLENSHAPNSFLLHRKMEAAKQKKRVGFNKQLIMRHYNDLVEEEKTAEPRQEPRVFWMELLVGKPQMSAIGAVDPEMKKFHYALVDGSSLT